MKYEILLRDGSKLKVEDNSINHMASDGTILYSYEGAKYSSIQSKEKKEMIDSYFYLIGDEEKEKVASWLVTVRPSTKAQKDFIERVKFALDKLSHTFKIATIEPSLNDEGRIFYKPNSIVGRGISYMMWDIEANSFYFDEEWSSKLASPEEGDLFTAYRVATGKWALEYVCDDSSSSGNYWDAPSSKHNFEPSGVRKVGGFRDGVGNTQKIFKDVINFIVFGGYFMNDGADQPVMKINSVVYDPLSINYHGAAVVVLRKI